MTPFLVRLLMERCLNSPQPFKSLPTKSSASEAALGMLDFRYPCNSLHLYTTCLQQISGGEMDTRGGENRSWVGCVAYGLDTWIILDTDIKFTARKRPSKHAVEVCRFFLHVNVFYVGIQLKNDVTIVP